MTFEEQLRSTWKEYLDRLRPLFVDAGIDIKDYEAMREELDEIVEMAIETNRNYGLLGEDYE